MNRYEEKRPSETSKWFSSWLALVSVVLGGGALWYAWFRYNTLASQPNAHWYGWVQVASMMFMGILCIWATVLFILGKPSGSSLLKLGITVVPLLLFSNLVILVFRVIQNILQGDAALFWIVYLLSHINFY